MTSCCHCRHCHRRVKQQRWAGRGKRVLLSLLQPCTATPPLAEPNPEPLAKQVCVWWGPGLNTTEKYKTRGKGRARHRRLRICNLHNIRVYICQGEPLTCLDFVKGMTVRP